jgi:chromosome partitioning protein
VYVKYVSTYNNKYAFTYNNRVNVLAIAARKGGSGKTSIAAHLAVEAERVGDGPVTVIDLDPQQSLAAWWNDRQVETPKLVEIGVHKLKQDLTKAANSRGLVILDTPPLDSQAITAVIEVSDLVLIPVKPSPHDLRGVGVTVELCEQVKRPFIFVVNQAIQRSAITQQAVLALSQYGPVATSIIHNRVDYAGAMTDGRTAPELDSKGKAAGEIEELWKYVHTQIRKHVKGAA